MDQCIIVWIRAVQIVAAYSSADMERCIGSSLDQLVLVGLEGFESCISSEVGID